MNVLQASEPNVQTREYGTTPDGQQITEFTLTNRRGNIVRMINYGATVTSIEIPDRDGQRANVILNYPDLEGYLQCESYFGSTVGRYCNRIALGRFELDGQTYQLATNNEPNHLHGGEVGFDKRVWQAETVQRDDHVGVRFTYHSPDGEEGYPGNLTATALYTWTDDDELIVELIATTDAPTHVNLTNHNYWNLAGAGSGTILDHQLQVHADRFLEVDDTLIPTGEKADVTETPFDFTSPRTIGERIDELRSGPGLGYDHCYVLRGEIGALRQVAILHDPASGRQMEILTTQPGLQFYSGNFLDGSPGGGGFDQHAALCLETQHYPDSPNQPDFPSTRLDPGDEYRHKTVHRFTVRDDRPANQ